VFSGEGRARGITLAVLCIGLFMVLLDSTIVNVALPAISSELDAELSGLQWVVDAYTLVMASLLLTAGAFGDRFGRKRVFMAGLTVFTIGSLACGLAPGLGALNAARAFQALGAAAIIPGSLSIIIATFTVPRERTIAISLWAAVSGIALAIGPVLGGLLVDGPGWRWVFFVNLPIGALALLATAMVVKESAQSRPRRLDLPGQAIGIVTLASLTWACIEGSDRGWTSGPILGAFALALAGVLTFLLVERRTAEPLIELGFFRDRGFATANALAFASFFSLSGFVFFNALFFQQVQGYSATASGVRALATTLAIAAFAPVGGRLSARFGPRVPVAIGSALSGTALLLLTGLHADTPYLHIWWQFTIFGMGLGLFMAPITAAAVSTMPHSQAGVASAVVNTSRQVGGVLGVAVLGAIVSHRFTTLLPGKLEALRLPAAVRDRVLAIADAGGTAASGGAAVPAPIKRVVGESFTSGITTGYLIAGLVMIACAIAAAWLLPKGAPSEAEAAEVPVELV
jgi:EmrB/QacA subfamily drug resistance transporter